MKADTRLMKQLNKSTLRNILSPKRTATKPELAIRRPKRGDSECPDLRNALSGEVQERGNVPSGGGRPSMQYGYCYEYRTVGVVYGHQLEGEATYIRLLLI